MATTALDPYATLGIPAGASRADAARAHRELAKRFHPDLNPGPDAAERMRRVNEAWRILSDPVRRMQYDADRAMAAGAAHWSRATAAYGPRAGTTTWTTWPNDRVAASPRQRRPPRPEPPEASFGDRRSVVVAVWVGLSLLFFIGSWLGSIQP